ncbi:GIY-YIG nuclease family protein [Candidatus Parcubacteria bacterium]|nr:GIY-YIG nuclease family protein [Candidatus Parcubacteria bacterium]
MYYVYIIKSLTNNKYYIGYTKNIKERLERHNEGRSRFTKNKGEWILVYQERYNSRGEAIKREKYIKSQKSRKFIESLIYSGVEK